MLRYPGGSLSNGYDWRTHKAGWWICPPESSFHQFSQLASTIGSDMIITTNYGTGTPELAAEWVRYANLTLKRKVKYWEVGNECFGFWEEDTRPRPHDPYTYGIEAAKYIRQMKEIDPTIKVGVVVENGEDSYSTYTDHPATNPRTKKVHNGWTPVMLTTLKSQGVYPDFVTYRRYLQGPEYECDDALLLHPPDWGRDMADIRQQMNDYWGVDRAKSIEIFLVEANSVFTKPGKQSTSIVNALHLADQIGYLSTTEAKSHSWFVNRHEQLPGNNNAPELHGWRNYGDYGAIAPNGQPYPAYYGFRILQFFASRGDAVVRVTTNSPLLAAYGIKRPEGYRLMVINKNRSVAIQGAFSLPAGSVRGTARMFSYGMAQDDAVRTGNLLKSDIATSSATVNTTRPVLSFAPYSITVIHFDPVRTIN
jgi:alpha-L-arabinofuranosidase